MAVFWYLDDIVLDWIGQTGPGLGAKVIETRGKVGYKSRPSLYRQEEKNSVRLFRVEPVNILVTSNTIKLVPFDWALNLVWFQICVRDSYLLRGIQNVNFNV